MRKRKRVALFANGWSKETLQEIGNGIYRCASEADVDVFAFVNYSLPMAPDEENLGELSIFQFPDMKDFDGVLLLANSLNVSRELKYLYEEWKASGVPGISIECELEGMDYFGSDNYAGMCELTEHMIKKHGVKEILFIGGTADHQDSQTRLKAVLDVAAQNGIQVPEGNIVYGSWAEGPTDDELDKWVGKNGRVPDVVMCANDIMALAACEWMEEHGYHVPEDVKVTGYDYIASGQDHFPTLTTVSRDGSNMGYRAMRLLLDKMAGKETDSCVMIKSRVMYGESCGCRLEELTAGKNVVQKKFDGMLTDQHFRHMYSSVRKVDALEDFQRSLAYFFSHDNAIEGSNFMLCIHPRFFSIDESELFYKYPGHADDIDLVCEVVDGAPGECLRLPVNEVIFRASERSEKPGNYIFVPVRGDDKVMGFAMLARDFEIANDFLLYIWTRHVNQYMEQVRSNVKIAELTRKLRELSVTDVLTGLYNRMGCERILYPFVEACQQKGGRGIVMLADIDRMKVINDKYGHSQGDLALQTVACILKEELPKGFMAARFGGDEFFIVGESDEPVSIEDIAKHVSKQLVKEIKRRKITFPLSISIGGVQLEQGEEFQLNDCLQRADDFMYRVKERHHKKLDVPE